MIRSDRLIKFVLLCIMFTSIESKKINTFFKTLSEQRIKFLLFKHQTQSQPYEIDVNHQQTNVIDSSVPIYLLIHGFRENASPNSWTWVWSIDNI